MVKADAFVGEHSPRILSGGGIRQRDLGLVAQKQYRGYLWLKPLGKHAEVEVALVWGQGPGNRAAKKLKFSDTKYSRQFFTFTPAGGGETNGVLEIRVLSGDVLLGPPSLMPADNVRGMRADTLALLKQLNGTVYRWPGGNFVSGYDWRDGLGDRDKRPTRTNPAWTGIETNDMGMHEFVRLCELIKSEPMIAVNTGFGDAYSAAAQVEYANGSTDTPMGKWRAKNGSAKPLAVKWWCVGNEMWGNWQLGYMQLRHYVLKHNWIEEKMREVDPTIKTVGSGDVGDAGQRSWTRGMLTSCADHMDLISEHFYRQEREPVADHVQQIPDAVRSIADAHRRYREQLDSLAGKDIRIALDEWNYWYGPHVFGELGTRYFMKDALGIAAGLHEMARNSDLYFMANYAQTVNVIGAIKTTETAAAIETTGLVLKLYRHHFGTVPVAVTGKLHGLDVAAAWIADKKAITIGIVNPTEAAYDVTLMLKGASLTGRGRCWTIAHDDPMAYNEPGQAPKVAIVGESVSGLSDTLDSPAYSVRLYELEVR